MRDVSGFAGDAAGVDELDVRGKDARVSVFKVGGGDIRSGVQLSSDVGASG